MKNNYYTWKKWALISAAIRASKLDFKYTVEQWKPLFDEHGEFTLSFCWIKLRLEL